MTDLRFVPGAAVDVRHAVRFGSWRVFAYRVRNMSKWTLSILWEMLVDPVLYLVAIGVGLGAVINHNSGGAGLDGVPYLQFVAPALMASAAIQGVMFEVTYPVVEGFIWNSYFDAVVATSISPKQIANGFYYAGVLRALLTVLSFGLILLAFGAIPVSSLLPLMAVSFLASSAWAAIIMAFSATLKKDEGMLEVLFRFVVAPMFLFSGTFYPLSSLPVYLQWLGWISPLWHATDVGRALTIGTQVAPAIMFVHFAFFVAMLVIGVLASHRVFTKRLYA